MHNDVQRACKQTSITLLEVMSVTCHQSCTDVFPKASCAVQWRHRFSMPSVLCYFPGEWLIIFEQPLDFPELSSDFLLHEFTQMYLCITSSLHTHNTLRVIFLPQISWKFDDTCKHCRLLFQFAHCLFLDIIFSPSKQHPEETTSSSHDAWLHPTSSKWWCFTCFMCFITWQHIISC